MPYGTYTAKLTQGFTNTFSTKVPTLYLMGKPSDVFVPPDGTIYVLNDATKKVLRYNSAGTLLMAGFDIQLANPNNWLQGMVLDSSGNILVAEFDVTGQKSRIQKYTNGGTLINACFIPWSLASCPTPNTNPGIGSADGISIDASNNIFVTDNTNKKIWRFAAAGGNIAPTTVASTSYVPREVVVDPSDNNIIYYVDAQFGTPAGRNYVTCRRFSGGSWGACANPWNSTLSLVSDCDPKGIDVDSTYMYVSCGCDSPSYVYGGDVISCADNIHRVYSYNKSTKALISSFGGIGDGDTQFSLPHGVALSPDKTKLYVAESANNRVKVLSLSAGSMTYAGHIYDEYSTPLPTSITIDDDDNVYVALSSSGIIMKFDSNGNLKCSLGGYGAGNGKFENIYGLAISGDGTYLWAGDVNDDSVDRFIFTNKDTCEGSWTIIDVPAPGNINSGPRGIVVEPGVPGNLASAYVLHDQNSKIYKYSSAGVRDNLASTSADPRHITMDKHGFIYIVYENGNVQKFHKNGTSMAITNPGIISGGGITVDDYGNLYVTDRGNYAANPPTRGMTVHRLGNYVRYNQSSGVLGAHEIKWQAHFLGNCDPAVAGCSYPDTTDGRFNSPWGIAVSPDGSHIWVADYGNNRIQKFNISYATTRTDSVTIGSATAPPDVSAVSISPASPVSSGKLEIAVSYNKSMTTYEVPSIQLITQNNCQLQVFDEAVVQDTGSVAGQYDAADVVLVGVTPAIGTTLIDFRGSTPYERYVESLASHNNNNIWNQTLGEPIARTVTTTFNATTDNVYYASQTAPAGIPTDINGQPTKAFSSDIKHTDNGSTSGYYDGYFVTNEWKGWVTIPTGSTACCGGSCDGTAQIQAANGKDMAGTIQSPNPWNVNTSTGFQFVIDSTSPTEPVITEPSDGTYTSQNSIRVRGSYSDANGSHVKVENTDFSCVIRDINNNNIYDAGDTKVYESPAGSCVLNTTTLIPMTRKEGWIDINNNGVYDGTEPIVGNYYDITANDPRYDDGTADRILVNAGTYANLDRIKMFVGDSSIPLTGVDSLVKTNRVSSQTVVTTGTFDANNIGLPAYKDYYITAVAWDTAGNISPYVSRRVKVTRGLSNPGVAAISPRANVGIDTPGEWTITYTSATAFDYPLNTGECSCGATPSTTANCYVTFTIPTGWAAPTKTSNTSGWTRLVTYGDTQLCAGDTFSISGQTIKVHIDSMNAGVKLDVVYGYSASGVDVTPQAVLGGNSFEVRSKNTADTVPVSVPPEAGSTLSINVEGYSLRVSHLPALPGTIYDNATNVKIMTLNFENTNPIGSGKTYTVSSMKLKFAPSGAQTSANTIAKISAISGATQYLNTTNIAAITDVDNYLTMTLADASSNPLTIGESSVNTLDIYMDFKTVSTQYPPGSSLEFLLDGNSSIETGAITAGLTERVMPDTSKAWTSNQWVSYTLIPDITAPLRTYRIVSNTSNAVKIRTGNMLTDGTTAVGDAYAIGDASNHVMARDRNTGTSLRVSPRSGAVTDTFYPDFGAANPKMTSGKSTQFKAPPIANGILALRRDTWAPGQTVSKGQTSTRPVTFTFRLFDQIVNSTNSGPDCSPTCSRLDVDDARVFAGLEMQSIIVGDCDGTTLATVDYVDTVNNQIYLLAPVGPYYKSKNMFLMREGASAKLSRLVFTLYECSTQNCAPITPTTNPRALLDKLALRETNSNPPFFYVNKADSAIEASGSTVQLDFSTYLQINGTESKSVDLVMDIDPNTTARGLKVGLLDATRVYSNSRKQLTNDCAACGRVYINNSVTNDIIQNERVFATTNGVAGEWSAVSGEAASYIDVTPALTGTYTTNSYVTHSKIRAGYCELGLLQSFPMDSLPAGIVEAAQLRVNKMYIRDMADQPLCPNTEAGSGIDNPEIYLGESFKVYLEVENIAAAPSSLAYVTTSGTDLSFVRNSDSSEKISEFTLSQPSIVGGACSFHACLASSAKGTLVYTVTQSAGTTTAPVSDSDYFKIDTNRATLIGAPECDVNKEGRYKPRSYDSNDYTDGDKFCVNPDSSGVDADPPNCRLSVKMAQAYAQTDPVPVRRVQAGSTFVPILNFTINDGPTGNPTQRVSSISIQSMNTNDAYIEEVQLWRDNGDSVINPYFDTAAPNNGTARQMILDDCASCSTLKVNNASRYQAGHTVTVCKDAACSISRTRTVASIDTASVPNRINLTTPLDISIVQKTDIGYVYVNPNQICDATGSNCDALVAKGTFSAGKVVFSGLTEDVSYPNPVRFYVTYTIARTLDAGGIFADGATLNAAIEAGGIVFEPNPDPVTAIPSSALASAGSSSIDVTAVLVMADPPSSQSCILGNRMITFTTEDIFGNRDRGSYGNPTYSSSNVTVTFTEQKPNSSVKFVDTSLTGAVYSPVPPPGAASQVQGNLSNGRGTVTLTNNEAAPPEDVTINITAGLTYKPSGGAVTTFGNNVCINAQSVDHLEPPPGQLKVPVIALQVINGLPTSITVDSLRATRTADETLLDSELTQLTLWKDSDNNGACDSCYPGLGAGESLLASGNYSGNTYLFSGLADTLAAGEIEYYYVLYDLKTVVVDGRLIDAEIPANGFTYISGGTPYSLDPTNSSNSPGTSIVNVVANILEIYPRVSTANIIAPNCDAGQGGGVNCLTFNVSDVSIFQIGDEVSIQDDDSAVNFSLSIANVNPIASSATPGTITLASPATGTYTVEQNAFMSNTPHVAKAVTVRAVDSFGNIASYPSNETYEASAQVTVTADNTQPDASATNVLTASGLLCPPEPLDDCAIGGPATTGNLNQGVGNVTFVENSCPPRSVLIYPSTSQAGFNTFNSAVIRFPGDWQKDSNRPSVNGITLGVSGDCITTATPEISQITANDDCSGIAAVRFACSDAALSLNSAVGPQWVLIEPAAVDVDVCCNCDSSEAGTSRDIKCGFDITNGQTCNNWNAATQTCDGSWVANTILADGGCTANPKRVYVQVRDRVGNTSIIPTIFTDPAVSIDNQRPDITALSLSSTIDFYHYGTADGLNCDLNQKGDSSSGLNSACKAWHNDKAGEGDGQVASINVSGTDDNAVQRLSGQAAFGEPAPSHVLATPVTPANLSVSYSLDATDPNDSETIYFGVYDSCENGKFIRVDFGRDNEPPEIPEVSGFASPVDLDIPLTSGEWYNYENPFFSWATGSDMPAGEAFIDNSGMAYFAFGFSTDSAEIPPYATDASSFFATGPLVSGMTYYVRMSAYDNVGNAAPPETAFVYKFDNVPPAIEILNPDASSWFNAGFNVEVSVSDPAPGAGMDPDACEWRVTSDSVEKLAWTSFSCASARALTVGAGQYCDVQGVGKCVVYFRAYDLAGNVSPVVSRAYSIDWTPPDPATTVVSAFKDSSKNPVEEITQEAGVWWSMTVPYFEWSDIQDIPAAPNGSGVAAYHIYFGTDSAGVPFLTESAAATIDYQALFPGATDVPDEYYLILKVEDNAGNISAAQTVFTYRFDKTAPEQPTNVWIYSQYGSPPPAPVLSPSTWYNYSDPFIDWEASIDVGSGLSGYYVVFATDSSYFYMDFDETMVFASAYDVGVRGPNLQSGGKYRLYLRAVDRARINPNISPLFTIIASEYWYDGTNPQTTINSPLAAQWQGADFALDVTNSDYIPGSGPTNCLIRVVSNLSQTLDWTAYDCATDPMITVGDTGGEYCDVEGEDVCQISLRVSDLAGNGPVETSRIYKIDWAPPIVTINSPAASSWQSADFLVDTTNFDSGSGVFVCEMKVVSGATETLNWSAYDCASDPTVTVGYSGVEYCAEEGEDICEVFFRATDRAGNISSVASRLFSVDWAPPATTINSPDASSWQRDDFVIDVTNFDSGSGVDVCEYKVTSDSVETLAWTVYDCATDPTISVGDSGGENCATLGADICQVSFRVTDRAGNLSLTTTRLFGIDWILPIVTIVSPDASSWQSADFLVDITNFDAHSGVLTCEVMAVSGATETLSWTAYDCASDPTATVGDTGGEYCDVEGDDACALSFRAVDRAGNISATATRAFSIDWAPPAATINAPAASSWQRDDFIVDVANFDSGSGVDVCEYKVVNDSSTTLDWTVYDCATDPTLTVGDSGGENCSVEGADICEVSFRLTDRAGNSSAVSSRVFGIDWTPPVILTGGFVEASDYLWISPSNNRLYFGNGMAAAQEFQVEGTASDALSGMYRAAFSAAFSENPADDMSADDWSGTYNIDSADAVADSVTVTVYDLAGNSASAVYQTVRNNSLSVEFLDLSPTGPPAFVQFKIYYPDGVTEMTTSGADGLFTASTVGFDVSPFVKVYDKDGNSEDVLDEHADALEGDFVIHTLAYQDGCGTAFGQAWCVELYTIGCASCLNTPHYIGIVTPNPIRADAFYSTLAEDKTTNGDLGGPPVGPPFVLGDPGTVEIGSGPDHLLLSALRDSIVTADFMVSAWCSGGCSIPCALGNYCSDVSYITDKPDFVKIDTGAGSVALSNIADNSTPAAGQWSWDTANKRVVLFDNPAAPGTSISATPYQGSETVCVQLVDGCGYFVVDGTWADDTVQVTMSQAPDSGKDISANLANADQGFANITVPADSNFTSANQIQVKGDIVKGKACFVVTAQSVPSDNPETPIRLDPEYFGLTPLTFKTGINKPLYLLIRPHTGIPESDSFTGIVDVEDVFVPTPDTTAQAIVLSPMWSYDGGKMLFASRQSNPCDGNAAIGDSEYSNFNIYTLTLSGGILTDCARLTSNVNDGFATYGVDPSSDVTWTDDASKVVFAAPDHIGTGRNKLFWVDSTVGVGQSVGDQYDYPPAGPVIASEMIWEDVLVGDGIIKVSLNPGVLINIGDKVSIYELDSFTGEISQSEIAEVTDIQHDFGNFVTEIHVTPNTVNAYLGMMSGGSSFVEYPATLRQMGQNIVPLDDNADWWDPNASGNYAECAAAYRSKLLAVRKPSANAEDYVCGPACAQDGAATTNANIVMISDTNADSEYTVGGGDNLIKVTNFHGAGAYSVNQVWPMKPKWSPDCKMISFLAWDRSPGNTNPTPPSKTSVYIINLDAEHSGFEKATLPISSLTDTGVYPIYKYDDHSMPANFPNWSADGKLVSYSLDRNNALDLEQASSDMDNLVNQMFGSSNYDIYLEYVLDQPESQGAIYSPQLMGNVDNNEMALAQCPTHAASTCPNKPNSPFVQVSQMYSGAGAYLRMLTLGDESEVNEGGGILFQDGIITAVFPPNVVASSTVFYNTDPTAYCGGVLLPDCPVDPTNDFIVQAGEAREYFPDGTNFESYARLIFRYCDNDVDGYVDAGTENVHVATAAGTKAFTYNSLTNTCRIDGVLTSGGTISADSLAVYYWDNVGSQWVRMDGAVDKVNKTITVFSKHFSRYDTLGFRTGLQAPVLVPLQITDIRTYPNPYVQSRNWADGIKFAAGGLSGYGPINIEIKVIDIRGSLVTTLAGVVNGNAPTDFSNVLENNAYTLLHWTNPVNAAGRPLASGVYLYYMTARTTNYEVTHKGKFSIVR